MKPRILIARPVPPAIAERAAAEFDSALAEERDLTLDEVLQQLEAHRAEGLFFSSNLKLNAEAIARLPPGLRVAATCSVGFDHVDVAAAKARGLVVTNTPDVLTDCTADLALLLILAASRRAGEYGTVMQGGWRQSFGMGQMLGTQVSNKTLGILGMGRIGRAVARRARGFNMRVIYHNPRRLPPELEQGAEYFPDFRAMLPQAQILSLHAPGGPATDRIMNAETFTLLPRGSVFVNVARGGLVDEDALIEALRSGHLAGAGLDVYRSEPDFDRRLAELPTLFLTPHMGSATIETRNAMGFRALDNLAAVLAGKPAIDPLWS